MALANRSTTPAIINRRSKAKGSAESAALVAKLIFPTAMLIGGAV